MTLDSLLLAAALWLLLGTLALLPARRIRSAGRAVRLAVGIAAIAGVVAAAAALRADPVPFGFAGIVITGLAVTLPARWWVAGALSFASLATTALIYTAYLVRATWLLGGDPISLALGSVLLLLELGAMGLIAASAFEMVDALVADADPPPMPDPPAEWPVVCLQVPAYNEPPDLVVETVRSLAAIDYPALRIQVIDNNTTDETLWRPVEAECERLRADGHVVTFVHLEDWPGFKAGALNWGRAHLDPDVDIVGIVDADYVVEPDFLRATVPHFAVPAVAFVQTPQEYRAWETSAFYRACHVGFAYFFKVGMVSRAHRDSIIFAGTMGLIRRRVLDEIGGWDEAIITEDAEASLRILARGYSAVYVPVAYGHGIMPLTYEGLRKQRYRWAFGGIQILRRHRSLLTPWSRASRLTLGQRYDYLVGGLWWFNDALTFGFTIFAFAAALGAFVGRPFVVQRLSALGVVIPLAFIGLNLLRYLWAMRQASSVGLALAMGGLRVNLSLSWVIAVACVQGLVQERGVFLRTPKFRGSPRAQELRLVLPETSLAIVGAALLLGVAASAGYSAVGLVLIALLGWSVLIYGSATGYALGDPTRAPISDALRDKARLELAPRVGRVLAAPRTRYSVAAGLGLAALLVAVGLANESGRPPAAAGGAPFGGALAGPLRPAAPAVVPTVTAAPSPAPSPSSPPSPSSSAPSSSGGIPGGSLPGTHAPTATPVATATARTTATSSPSPTPVPTPSPQASASAAPSASTHPTPAPRPSPSSRPSGPPGSPSPPR